MKKTLILLIILAVLFAGCAKKQIYESKNYYDLTVSNDPAKFLGDRIAQESPSNWKNYEPLTNKVAELTKNKNDEEKVVAISNWVKDSRSYNFEWQSISSPANSGGTVIDIFNSDMGVCYDYSILTVAMLRLANIPARSVLSSNHAWVQYYINGEWKSLDNTGSDDVRFFSDRRVVLGVRDYEGRIYTKNGYGVFDISRGFQLKEGYRVYAYVYTDLDDSGYIYYPALANFFIGCNYDLVKDGAINGGKGCRILNLYETFKENKPSFGLVLKANLYDIKGKQIPINIPSNSYAFNPENPLSEATLEGVYLKIPVPTGRYKFYVAPNTPIDNLEYFAYLDINISKNQEVWLDESNWIKPDNIHNDLFNSFSKTIEGFKQK
jgi:hypothetical protein